MNRHKQLLTIGREAIGYGCKYSEHSSCGRRRIGYACANRNGEFEKLVTAVKAAGFGSEVNLINANCTQSGWPFIRIMYPAHWQNETELGRFEDLGI